MISVIICKSNQTQRESLHQLISNHIVMEQLGMKIQLSTGNPEEVLDYLDENPDIKGLYVLGANLRHRLNGISLARKIREKDVSGKIIYVTVHAELAYLPYTYRVEALDFIIEDGTDVTLKKVRDGVQVAYERMIHDKKIKREFFKLNKGGRVRLIPLQEIMFFEAGEDPRSIILYTEKKQIKFRSSLKEIADGNQGFHRCHQSYVVNIANIKEIDRKNRIIQMMDGQFCEVSAKGLKDLREIGVLAGEAGDGIKVINFE